MPDGASVPWKAHRTAWFHQPFWSAARSGVASVTFGAVASYLIGTLPLAELPAMSRHLPPTLPAPVSGPGYGTVSQLAMPDVASFPWKAMLTEWFHQPFLSAARDGAAPVTFGAVASYLIEVVPVFELPATSRQSPLTVPVALSGPE